MYGFSLGYFWLFPTTVVWRFVRLLRQLYGSYWAAMRHVATLPGKWFGELALFVFMLHIDPDRHRYTAVDVQSLLRRHVPERAPLCQGPCLPPYLRSLRASHAQSRASFPSTYGAT